MRTVLSIYVNVGSTERLLIHPRKFDFDSEWGEAR
jgi:hypothetical protein